MDLMQLLAETVQLGASDLHVSSGLSPRVRIDGELTPLEGACVLSDAELLDQLSAIRPPKNTQNLEQDFSFAFKEGIRFRVNIFYQLRGISAVFRAISREAPALESLPTASLLKNLCALKTGLILVTGPTGCGKSTTLAAMIQHINLTQNAHIISLEDPIEYVYQSEKSLIQQREIHQHTASFQDALRAALREDPDVILVGEMRDLETIRLALTAAETGHLVLATLHTQSCSATINRIIDVFPAGDKELVRNMLADSLQAVISQTLVKKKNGGRVAAQEIMMGTTPIRNLIRENKTAQILSAIQTGRASGMQTMDESLKELKKLDLIN
ncbi:MAG: type IV pilus twitching motility protein PilT [Pseudomonadota bacterium]